MFGDLLKRLAALLFTLLAMALSFLAILYLQPLSQKSRTHETPGAETRKGEALYFDRQKRKSPEDPWYGKMVSPLAPGQPFLIPRKLARQKESVGQGVLNLRYFGVPVAQIAYGVDDVPYFVNAFFVDFAPGRIGHLWEAHRRLQLRLRYQLDDRHFPGRKEVWQTSAQTFRSLWGDCEDLSIFLADWLISAGYDARVVLGTYGKEGHAWVVVFLEGDTFLIEATSRRPVRHYPLAKLLPRYHPETMFNRDTFWVNAGSPLTTDYRSDRWRERAHFVRFPSSGRAGS